MSEIECDDCGERPYVTPAVRDYEDHHDMHEDPDAELWCECPKDIPIVFEHDGRMGSKRPDHWGQSANRFVCYECGEVPLLIHTAGGIGRHPDIRYRLTCRCGGATRVTFNWCDVMPDTWKDYMDYTKWPDMSDEIFETIEDHGPLSVDELTGYIDLPKEGIECIAIKLQRDERLYRDSERGYMTPYMMTEYETGTAPEQIEEESEQRDDNSDGLLARLFGWGED